MSGSEEEAPKPSEDAPPTKRQRRTAWRRLWRGSKPVAFSALTTFVTVWLSTLTAKSCDSCLAERQRVASRPSVSQFQSWVPVEIGVVRLVANAPVEDGLSFRAIVRNEGAEAIDKVKIEIGGVLSSDIIDVEPNLGSRVTLAPPRAVVELDRMADAVSLTVVLRRAAVNGDFIPPYLTATEATHSRTGAFAQNAYDQKPPPNIQQAWRRLAMVAMRDEQRAQILPLVLDDTLDNATRLISESSQYSPKDLSYLTFLPRGERENARSLVRIEKLSADDFRSNESRLVADIRFCQIGLKNLRSARASRNWAGPTDSQWCDMLGLRTIFMKRLVERVRADGFVMFEGVSTSFMVSKSRLPLVDYCLAATLRLLDEDCGVDGGVAY